MAVARHVGKNFKMALEVLPTSCSCHYLYFTKYFFQMTLKMICVVRLERKFYPLVSEIE